MGTQRLLTTDDKKRAKIAMDEIQIPNNLKTYGSVANRIKPTDDSLNMHVIHVCQEIVSKWAPKVDRDGKVTSTPLGNADDPDALDQDALQLAAMNITISTLKGTLDSMEKGAEEENKIIEAELREAIREEKRSGFDGNPTEKELTDVVLTHPTYRKAHQILDDCRRAKGIVEATYYSVKDMQDRLQRRVMSLVSEWGKSTRKREI